MMKTVLKGSFAALALAVAAGMVTGLPSSSMLAVGQPSGCLDANLPEFCGTFLETICAGNPTGLPSECADSLITIEVDLYKDPDPPPGGTDGGGFQPDPLGECLDNCTNGNWWPDPDDPKTCSEECYANN